MKKETTNILLIGGGIAALYFLFVKDDKAGKQELKPVEKGTPQARITKGKWPWEGSPISPAKEAAKRLFRE
jgi:hypothetical protein